MPASISVNGSTSTITISITSTTDNIQMIFGTVCKYLWNDGYGDHGTDENPIQYASLTNQQKLDIFHAYVVRSIKNILILDSREKSKLQNQAAAEAYGI